MIPQAVLIKVATMVFDKFIAPRLHPLEDYVHKENELDIQMREMKVEITGLKEQITLLKDLVVKYSA
jgi:p-aminobenzoyl-glutamate transporter AbgT